MATPGGMRPADIGALVDVGEPRVAPDGRRIAFVVTTIDVDANQYRSRVWVVDADGGSPPRPLTAEHRRHVHPRWSPDGTRLAYVSLPDDDDGERGDTVIHVLPFFEDPLPDRGSGSSKNSGPSKNVVREAIAVAAWPEPVEDLAWSPDGATLAFTARVPSEDTAPTTREGRKVRAKDQPPRRLTTLFSRLDNVGWIHDRPRHLLVVPPDGSARPRLVTAGPADDDGLAWSPDGTQLAFTSARHPDWDLTRAVDLFVVPARGDAEPRCVTGTDLSYHLPSWSPAGDRIAVQVVDARTEPRHTQVAVIDLAGGSQQVLTGALDRQCAPFGANREPVWDGDALLVGVEDHGNVHLYRVAPDRAPEALIAGDRAVTAFDSAGGTLAFCASTPAALSELYVLDPGGTERRLTEFGRSFCESRQLVAPEHFVVRSSGGAEVDAWIMRPAGFEEGRAYPTLLNIHGGPFTQYGNRFFDEFQIQAGGGFAVLYCNPRGSSGSTEAWGRAIRWPECDDDPGSGWGGVDYDDVMAVVDAAVAQFDFVDAARLGVLGGSYGGYMTSWIIGHTDRFKAACSERGVNDILALEYDSDIASTFADYVGVSHIDDPEPYQRQSPIRYVKNMTTPVLIVHSENDLRCPISQAEELFVALRLLRRDVEFVRFPGEGHELSRSGAPLHRVQRAEILLDYFMARL